MARKEEYGSTPVETVQLAIGPFVCTYDGVLAGNAGVRLEIPFQIPTEDGEPPSYVADIKGIEHGGIEITLLHEIPEPWRSMWFGPIRRVVRTEHPTSTIRILREANDLQIRYERTYLIIGGIPTEYSRLVEFVLHPDGGFGQQQIEEKKNNPDDPGKMREIDYQDREETRRVQDGLEMALSVIELLNSLQSPGAMVQDINGIKHFAKDILLLTQLYGPIPGDPLGFLRLFDAFPMQPLSSYEIRHRVLQMYELVQRIKAGARSQEEVLPCARHILDKDGLVIAAAILALPDVRDIYQAIDIELFFQESANGREYRKRQLEQLERAIWAVEDPGIKDLLGTMRDFA